MKGLLVHFNFQLYIMNIGPIYSVFLLSVDYFLHLIPHSLLLFQIVWFLSNVFHGIDLTQNPSYKYLSPKNLNNFYTIWALGLQDWILSCCFIPFTWLQQNHRLAGNRNLLLTFLEAVSKLAANRFGW